VLAALLKRAIERDFALALARACCTPLLRLVPTLTDPLRDPRDAADPSRAVFNVNCSTSMIDSDDDSLLAALIAPPESILPGS